MFVVWYNYHMSWGTQRRNTILFIFFAAVFLFLAYVIYDALYEPPNCFDEKFNGDEVGIDCGGSCDLFCSSQVLNPIIKYTRLFEVAPGIYNVLAYVENPNPTAGIENIPYRFKIYDDENVLLQERRGVMNIYPKLAIPVLENSLNVGKLEATRVVFEFGEELVWYKKSIKENTILIQDEQITNTEEEPRIRAVVKNIGLTALKNVKLVAVVYDEKDNAIGASSTIFNTLPPNTELEAFFVWPQPFKEDVSRFELIPVYDRSDN